MLVVMSLNSWRACCSSSIVSKVLTRSRFSFSVRMKRSAQPFPLAAQTHDMKGVASLIRDTPLGALLADKAFDADWLLQQLDERGATAVIPPKSNRKVQRDDDTHMYKWRHLIENDFAKIKEFRCMATRYDKTDTSHAASRHLSAIFGPQTGLQCSHQPCRQLASLHNAHRRKMIVNRP